MTYVLNKIISSIYTCVHEFHSVIDLLYMYVFSYIICHQSGKWKENSTEIGKPYILDRLSFNYYMLLM